MFPRAAGEFDHVLGGGTNVIVIDRGRHNDSICFSNRRTYFLGCRLSVTGVRIAHWQVKLVNVEPFTVQICLLQSSKGDPSHSPAIAIGIAAGTDDEVLWHLLLGLKDDQGLRNGRISPLTSTMTG